MARKMFAKADEGVAAIEFAVLGAVLCLITVAVGDLGLGFYSNMQVQNSAQAGAEYAVTQPVFDLRLLENFLKRIEHCRIPIVAGIWPLVSVRNAEFMKNELRVSVPDSILERMARAQTPEAARAEGVAIAREMLIAARQMVQGAQISAPSGRYSSAVDVLEALGTSAPAASS